MDKARRIRGDGDRFLGWVDRASVREARRYQRDIVLPVLSGLHSRDRQRKTRLAWLQTLHWERFLAGVKDLPATDRAEHVKAAWSAHELLRWYRWQPVLP